MNLRIRPIELDDLERLEPLDADYGAAHGQPRLISPASLRFFARTGHAFVAELDPESPRGFVLAQALWDGVRPTLWCMRLVASDAAALAALAEALVKSAYDAAVYHLRAEVPEGDSDLQAHFLASDWQPRPMVRLERVLGSRSRG